MKDPLCGCCEGIEPLTPVPTVNRPGLEALSYRVGTHATFFESMLARLSSHRLDDGRRPLQRLTSHAPDDPAIALLDAWATVADVLTFYQERIANEGYLLTATERRSVLELARLVGYKLRPGVAASVFLAFTLDEGFDIEIPAGTRARSLPGPDELPQAFETGEALRARTAWNAIAPRLTRPPFLQPDATFQGTRRFFPQGTGADLKINDTVLFVCPSAVPQPYTVSAVEIDAAADRTLVTYTPYGAGFSAGGVSTLMVERAAVGGSTPESALTRLTEVVQALKKDPSLQPATRFQLARSLDQTYSATSDLGPQLLAQFTPKLQDTLYTAYANAPVTGVTTDELCHVEAMRVKAAPFGHNAPKEFVTLNDNGKIISREWTVQESPRLLSLDAVYDEIAPGSYVVVDRAGSDIVVAQVLGVRTISRADYGIAAKVTQLELDRDWFTPDSDVSIATCVSSTCVSLLRKTTVYAQTEPLELAEDPIEDDVAGDVIELDGLYDGLEGGRWLVVRGERTDVLDANGEIIEGVVASELVMLAGVVHDVQTILDANDNRIELPTDTLHTSLTLAEPLAYTYKRDTVTINANVVGATHGETREETLGSGDTTKAFQEFSLGQSPLTFVAAPTPAGVESTLELRVNEVRWPEHETLLFLDGIERGYVTKTDDDGITTVIFGDGKRGARLPTGDENVRSVYRSGIGKSGNVKASQISMLATRPLGVKEVINPQRASGGADAESRDQARRNVPLAVLALDRLVSVQDYADFARTFAGIGKASAASLSDGRREVVHLTVAGADDVPIDASSDLYRNLSLALSRFGDPNAPVQVALREVVFLFVSARVRVLEDYLWENVAPKIRAALLDALSFDRRELGQDVLLSTIISVVQHIEGVDYVDVDLLDSVSETDALDAETLGQKLEALASAGTAAEPSDVCSADAQPKQRLLIDLARIDPAVTDPALRIRPAQMAYLNPALPDTLVLTEVTA